MTLDNISLYCVASEKARIATDIMKNKWILERDDLPCEVRRMAQVLQARLIEEEKVLTDYLLKAREATA